MPEKNNENMDSGSLIDKKYSTLHHLSYNSMTLIMYSTWLVISTYYFFFYEVVIGLSGFLIALAMVMFEIWDAFNDPLIGYLSDKPTRFTKRWGRRFPWIILGIVPLSIAFILFWTPPQGPEITIFLWFVIIMLIYELGYTLVGAPYWALFPDKFRSDSERRKNSGLNAIIMFIAVIVSSIIPAYFIIERDANSYLIAALILLIPIAIFTILALPGIREDQDIINRALTSSQSDNRISFFKSLRIALKNKNFIAFAFFGVAFQMVVGLFLATLPYYCIFVLNIGIEYVGLLLFLYFIALIGSMLIWYKVLSKIGNKNTLIIGMLIAIIAFFLIFLIGGSFIGGIYIAIIILGFGAGALTIVALPIFSDIIDEITLKTRIPKEGIYSGIFAFINRFGWLLPPIIIVFVHTITFFNPQANFSTQPLLAKQGIIALISWIPAIVISISVVGFSILYKLTDERTKEIKEELRQLNL